MSVNLILFHQLSAGDPSLPLPSGYWHMATCLRSIVLADHEFQPGALKNHEKLTGEKAFEFLLQVVCGLHSPLVGETEVLGQFKNFVNQNQKSFSANIRQVLNQILMEAKGIRTEYLQNLGCTSYGSLLRKHLKDSDKPIVFIGAGSLTQDILPWLVKKNHPVKVLTRNPQKYHKLFKKYKNVELLSLKAINQLAGSTLVVAAPVSSLWLSENLTARSFYKIFDLRGESKKDPIEKPNVTPLETLFADIEKNKKQASLVKDHAFRAIRQRAVHLGLAEKIRPFGWEDLWA